MIIVGKIRKGRSQWITSHIVYGNVGQECIFRKKVFLECSFKKKLEWGREMALLINFFESFHPFFYYHFYFSCLISVM